jgi:IPT/TIG domain
MAQQSQEHGQHPRHQSEPSRSRDLVKPGSTIDPKGRLPASQQGQPGQQQGQPPAVWPQGGSLSDADREQLQKHQQEAWDLAAEREKSNNPATRKLRQSYDKNAPGMHPANQPAPDTKLSKGTRLDLEDLTGNPGHRGVNPDAPAGSINGPPDDKTGRTESINEPSHIDQNMPPAGLRNQPGGGFVGSINEPPGSQVIPQGAGQGAGGAAGGQGTEYQTPEIDSLNPDEIELGTPDLTVRVLGSGFTPQSHIEVEGEVQSSSFVNEGELTFTIKPGDYAEAGVVEVTVSNGGYKSEAVEFELLDAETPAASRQSKRRKPRSQGKKR